MPFGRSILVHPVIQRFETRAELLDLQNSRETFDDALDQLAAGVDLAGSRLTQDKLAVLVCVGGVFYREGLRTRMSPR